MQKDKKIRIQKYLSDIGAMSRRAAEREIVAGNISVNGITSKLGDKIDPDIDTVLFGGMPVVSQNKKYYILLNKPAGYITSMKDEFGRKTVTELLSDIPCRLYPVGRLDYQSEGALILTNDGDFANKVIHPSYTHQKVYNVYAKGSIDENQLTVLNNMRMLDGEKIHPVSVKVVKSYPTHTVLEFILQEGKNRQIRRMCESANINIMQLKRISVGKVRLGDLPSGCWRHLTSNEIKSFYVK